MIKSHVAVYTLATEEWCIFSRRSERPPLSHTHTHVPTPQDRNVTLRKCETAGDCITQPENAPNCVTWMCVCEGSCVTEARWLNGLLDWSSSRDSWRLDSLSVTTNEEYLVHNLQGTVSVVIYYPSVNKQLVTSICLLLNPTRGMKV